MKNFSLSDCISFKSLQQQWEPSSLNGSDGAIVVSPKQGNLLWQLAMKWEDLAPIFLFVNHI